MLTYKMLDQILHSYNRLEQTYLAVPGGADPVSAAFEEQGPPVQIAVSTPCDTFRHAPHPDLKLVKTGRFRPVPPHIHAWIELGYLYSGSCPHRVHGNSYVLKKGQVYILDSDAPHSIGCLGENDILISLLISKPFFTEAFFHHFTGGSVVSEFLSNALSAKASHDNYLLFRAEKNRRIPMLLNELMCEHIEPSTHARAIADNLISLLFLELVNVYEEEQSAVEKRSALIPVLKYIESNYLTCSLTSAAGHFRLNPNYLTTLLKKETGLSFKELVQKQRFYAITDQLKSTSLSVEEIARQNGYESTTHFYRKFREYYGCSPSEYRRM
ncbi:helix-turn-helix transcriptional regulator [Lachnotalea sp. AF33-28]|uniref:helix-turn-helix transcriptional regulator n=1 Tax=Lachnotalea sp. AF33-28 TaxID=2292046 RepID=UPI0013141442|nr:AraC family transcriptional regulator [Lachnotalea sp. AF33-28]